MRLALTSLELVAMFAVCALAYFSHDPDPSYPVLCKKHDTLQTGLERVRAERDGAKKRYFNIASGSKDKAEELIHIYRRSNQSNRNGIPVPGFFNQAPGLPDISENNFPLQTSNIIVTEDTYGEGI